MKKLILVPDSFKGTLSSRKICEILSAAAKKFFPACEVISVPVADGGEGSVECFLTALGGEKIVETVKGPYFEEMSAHYGIIEQGNTAVIEMAACAGLPLVEDRKDPAKTTTYGVGQLMLSAAKRGCKKILLGLGGSCTNDGGTGAAAAVGVRFWKENGEEFIPTGGTLQDIHRIDTAHLAKELQGVEIVTMCDISNPLYGETGAAYVFAPQKGADPAMVEFLDQGLRHLSEKIREDLHFDVSQIPGGGAAGGMGAGVKAFFGSQLKMGIQVVLETVRFSELLQNADAVITGEGKLDSQSLAGKVVIGVAQEAKEQKVPVIAIVGGAEPDVEAAYEMGVTAVFPINRKPQDFSVSRYHSEENLRLTAENVFRLWLSAAR